MSQSKPLKRGDVIEFEIGDRLYIDFNQGCLKAAKSQLSKDEVTIGTPKYGLDTGWIAGRYVVIATISTSDEYTSGRYVLAERLVPEGDNSIHPILVSFYETGCYTIKHSDLVPIGRATAKWTVEMDEPDRPTI